MIKEVKKKIHFIAFAPTRGRIKDTSPEPTAAVNGKYKRIIFSPALIRETGMDGKFVRLYYVQQRRLSVGGYVIE